MSWHAPSATRRGKPSPPGRSPRLSPGCSTLPGAPPRTQSRMASLPIRKTGPDSSVPSSTGRRGGCSTSRRGDKSTDLGSTSKDPQGARGVLTLEYGGASPADPFKLGRATIAGLSKITREKLNEQLCACNHNRSRFCTHKRCTSPCAAAASGSIRTLPWNHKSALCLAHPHIRSICRSPVVDEALPLVLPRTDVELRGTCHFRRRLASGRAHFAGGTGGYSQDVSGSKCCSNSIASCSTRLTTRSAGSVR